ncbi:MAG: hypothetical protein OXI23_18675, partial [Gemmatimonadota bacterium]|nr:hypothetical protein [Gemmatimonadota bacterium]
MGQRKSPEFEFGAKKWEPARDPVPKRENTSCFGYNIIAVLQSRVIYTTVFATKIQWELLACAQFLLLMS